MIAVRPGAARGVSRAAGSVVRHAFSCGDYFDPARMGFGPLRVLNEIELAPGAGLARERRANVQLLTFVIAGEVHRQSGDDSAVLAAGDAHVLGAGHGIEDGISNTSTDVPARLLQAWIQPARLNAAPHAAHRHGHAMNGSGPLLLASADGREGSIALRAPVDVWRARPSAGSPVGVACCFGRRMWVQVVAGEVEVGAVRAVAGDAAVVLNERRIELVAPSAADLLVFVAD